MRASLQDIFPYRADSIGGQFSNFAAEVINQPLFQRTLCPFHFICRRVVMPVKSTTGVVMMTQILTQREQLRISLALD